MCWNSLGLDSQANNDIKTNKWHQQNTPLGDSRKAVYYFENQGLTWVKHSSTFPTYINYTLGDQIVDKGKFLLVGVLQLTRETEMIELEYHHLVIL